MVERTHSESKVEAARLIVVPSTLKDLQNDFVSENYK